MNLLMSRRALGCAIAATFIERVLAVPAGVGELPAMPMRPGEFLPPTWGSLDALSSGALGATGKELTIAKRVLEKAPSAVNPYEVAQYFDRVGRGLESPPGEDWKPYVQEWPQRYNPVILNFFDATTIRKPEGDCTAWCSAFVNWCLERGRTGRSDPKKLTPATRSAASQSFRDWGQQTSNPKPGDIVVFRNVNSPGQGHVGFYSGQTDDYVIVLGGNQGGLGGLDRNDSTCSNPGSVGGRVVEQRMRKRGSSLVLHSFRTDQSLHDISSPTSNSAATSEAQSSQTEKPTQDAGKRETPGGPNQQTANANPAQTEIKPPEQTVSVNPAQTTIKPPEQTVSVNPAQTAIKPIQQTTSTASVATKETIVEIEFLNGRKLRVGANIDPDILARIITAIDK